MGNAAHNAPRGWSSISALRHKSAGIATLRLGCEMLIFDFFSGTGSATQAFRDAGHTVISIELDAYFNADERDIMKLDADFLRKKYGQPDFIWASPPCTAFSVASVSHHWIAGGDNPIPRSQLAKDSQELIEHTLRIIHELNPSKGWLMENPRGMMRKLSTMKKYPRKTVTYCQYGESRMKPTDLWGEVPGWTSRPMCRNGAKCHEAAPRGAQTGTQGIKGARLRSRVPIQLSQELLSVIGSVSDE